MSRKTSDYRFMTAPEIREAYNDLVKGSHPTHDELIEILKSHLVLNKAFSQALDCIEVLNERTDSDSTRKVTRFSLDQINEIISRRPNEGNIPG